MPKRKSTHRLDELADRIERLQTVMLALLDEVKNDRDYWREVARQMADALGHRLGPSLRVVGTDADNPRPRRSAKIIDLAARRTDHQ